VFGQIDADSTRFELGLLLPLERSLPIRRHIPNTPRQRPLLG
jgi:hypothetical protein